jgi:hypothetical protein
MPVLYRLSDCASSFLSLCVPFCECVSCARVPVGDSPSHRRQPALLQRNSSGTFPLFSATRSVDVYLFSVVFVVCVLCVVRCVCFFVYCVLCVCMFACLDAVDRVRVRPASLFLSRLRLWQLHWYDSRMFFFERNAQIE